MTKADDSKTADPAKRIGLHIRSQTVPDSKAIQGVIQMTRPRIYGLPSDPLEEWTRNNPDLDSQVHRIFMLDLDRLVWLPKKSRLFGLEIKSRGARTKPLQAEPLGILDSMLRRCDGCKFATLYGPRRIQSEGIFELCISGSKIEGSELLFGRIGEDGCTITIHDLTAILRGDVSPQNLLAIKKLAEFDSEPPEAA